MSQWSLLMRCTFAVPTQVSDAPKILASGPIRSDLILPYSSREFIGTIGQGNKLQRVTLRYSKQAHGERASDFDPDDELSGADDDAGGVAIRQMESGKLLPLHAGTL